MIIVHLKNIKKLQNSFKPEENHVLKEINKAIDILENNPFSGIQIPKRQIPKEYNKIFRPDNFWKYDLSKSWRLRYWISSDDKGLITLLIDRMNHKQYNKLFGYKSS